MLSLSHTHKHHTQHARYTDTHTQFHDISNVRHHVRFPSHAQIKHTHTLHSNTQTFIQSSMSDAMGFLCVKYKQYTHSHYTDTHTHAILSNQECQTPRTLSPSRTNKTHTHTTLKHKKFIQSRMSDAMSPLSVKYKQYTHSHYTDKILSYPECQTPCTLSFSHTNNTHTRTTLTRTPFHPIRTFRRHGPSLCQT